MTKKCVECNKVINPNDKVSVAVFEDTQPHMPRIVHTFCGKNCRVAWSRATEFLEIAQLREAGIMSEIDYDAKRKG